MADNDLIILKNSNPLNKYPVDADELNHNFEILNKNQGGEALKQFIESSGQVYSPLITTQLAMAVAQYVVSAGVFSESGTTDAFILQGKDGFITPYRYTDNMTVSFVPTRTNIGAMTLQIGRLDPFPVLVGGQGTPAGFLNVGTYTTFRFKGTYWEQVSSATGGSTGGGSTGGGSTGGGDSSAAITNLIREAITSAAIGFNPSDSSQLAQAIAVYVSRYMYSSLMVESTYNLTAPGTQVYPPTYREGMVITFQADANCLDNPYVKVGSLQSTQMVDFFGNILSAGDIVSGEFVTCIYTGTQFKVISQYQTSLSLANNHKVNTISNDPTLVAGLPTALVTEYAVKQYVDTKVKSTKANVIISGYQVNGESAALRVASTSVVQLMAGNGSTSEYLLEEETPTDSSNIIVSGNAAKALNPVAHVGNVYWESEKSGFAVDDVSRIVTGETGSKYVTQQYDTGGNYVYLHNPKAPCYYGFKNLTKVYSTLKLQHTDANHTPQAIQLWVNTNASLGESFWTPLCNRSGSAGFYTPDFSYGYLEVLTPETDGTYTITIPKYIVSGNTVEAFNPTTAYAMRIVAYTFNNQFATNETVNTAGYDPNNDTSDTTIRYTWQISKVELGNTVNSIPPFVLTYPDETIEQVKNPLYFTLFGRDDTTTNQVVRENPTTGRYIIYKIYEDTGLYALKKENVFRQTQQPPANEANEGSVWINLGVMPNETYLCVSNSAEDGTLTYSWEKTRIMLLGGFDVVNGNITNAINYRYGDILVIDSAMTANYSNTIAHNFGSDVSVTCYLVCTAANNSYVPGESVLVDLHQLSVYDNATTTNQLSYFVVSNTNITTRIDSSNLKIINRNTKALASLPNNAWNLRVYVEKD